jgi:hypothetical protein
VGQGLQGRAGAAVGGFAGPSAPVRRRAGRGQPARKECAERLLEIGFDGYGFGGWPIDGEGRLREEVQWVAERIPAGRPAGGEA